MSAATGHENDHFVLKANATCLAWKQLTGALPPSALALVIPMAQAQFETREGDAWPYSHNWGAMDYRACTASELAEIEAGTLCEGNWLFSDGTHDAAHDGSKQAVATLHRDTHADGSPFYVWFAASDDDVEGAKKFLRVIFGMAKTELLDPNVTGATYSLPLYMHCYYEGEPTPTLGAPRPCGHRSLPLTLAEQHRVDVYAKNIDAIVKTIQGALDAAQWLPPGYIEHATGEVVRDEAAPDTVPTGVFSRGESKDPVDE